MTTLEGRAADIARDISSSITDMQVREGVDAAFEQCCERIARLESIVMDVNEAVLATGSGTGTGNTIFWIDDGLRVRVADVAGEVESDG